MSQVKCSYTIHATDRVTHQFHREMWSRTKPGRKYTIEHQTSSNIQWLLLFTHNPMLLIIQSIIRSRQFVPFFG